MALEDRSKILLLHGPSGSGKSVACATKMHIYMKHYPNSMGLMLRKNRESMVNSTVLMMEREIVGEDPDVIHYPSKKRFEYSNGSILAYGGMKDEKQRQQIRSIGRAGAVDICWMEEANAFTLDDFQELKTRMRGKAAPWRQIMLSTNPDSPHHWINQLLILGGGATEMFFPTTDNPAVDDEYMDTLRGLTGIARVRFFEGKWKQAEGVVYPTFDEKVHVVEQFDIPANWRRFGAIDFGFTHPFVFLWCALSDDDELFVYRQIYISQTTITDLATMINRINDEYEEQLEFIVADWDAGDRAVLEQRGIATISAKKPISTGIQLVEKRLQRSASTGKPRLFFFRDSLYHQPDETLLEKHLPVCTEEEFSYYVWVYNQDGLIKTEVPADKNNHGMDAIRYIIYALDGSRLGAQPVFPSDIYSEVHKNLLKRRESDTYDWLNKDDKEIIGVAI